MKKLELDQVVVEAKMQDEQVSKEMIEKMDIELCENQQLLKKNLLNFSRSLIWTLNYKPLWGKRMEQLNHLKLH